MTSSIYYSYTAFNDTLSTICKATSTNPQDIIRVNTQMYTVDKTVGQFLTECQLNGNSIPNGLLIRIPVPITGGKEPNKIQYETKEVTDPGTTGSYKIKSVVAPGETKVYTLKKPTGVTPLSTTQDSYKKFNCFITVYYGGIAMNSLALPVYPQEFSDNNQAHFETTSIFGRSVPYQTYNSSGRSVSVTLQLHEELCTDYNYIHKLVALVESSCYPKYNNNNQVSPPEIKITIGKQFSCRGIIESCSATWKAPIIDGKYVNCDLNLGITETTGPYSMSNVYSKQGWR